ncbi:hypothetical protein [Steroidobacter agaridevorans]|uniref:hypothetical protein n=1 Tax=Steroidobacter agaridevorans TaxID=2695856 RepID=UPI00132C02E3|nr:hypothetical protein [Steroidobacter agaridevorans]GFE89758.1 hypothetical protein GCM10011488_47120 [Steroidobacter agaridevorans]
MDQVSIWGSSQFGLPDTFGSFQSRTRELLIALRGVDPEAFDNLTVIGSERATVVASDLSDLDNAISEIASSTFGARNHLEMGADGQLQPGSLSRIGFAAAFCTSGLAADTIVPIAEGGIDLSVRGGAAGIDSSAGAKLKISGKGRPSRMLAARLLEAIVRVWRCNVGGVSLKNWENAVRSGHRDSYAGQWLFYLPFPHLSKCLPPDIRHEPFANGILIETTPHMPDANNPADVAAGKRVRDVLDEFGLVNDATYAIEGWPPDKEEAVYEQFISGAPANRKYTVHCINFDGYDPDRKVLLYAKLFRRLKRHPKEWGLRGWDGPVLNEAKRQVRAAAKAGGVPIEWHIGLEEPAHQARQLLADHTNITEQQLRVIYTPLDQVLNRSPS